MLIIHVSGHHRDRIDERDDANFELLIAFVLGMSLRPCFRTLKIKIYQDRDQTLNNEIRKKSTLLFSPLAACRFRADLVKDPESGARGLLNNT